MDSRHIHYLEPATGRSWRVHGASVAPADLQRAGELLAAAMGRHDRVAPANLLPDQLELCGIVATARGMRATVQRNGAPLADLAIALHSRAGAGLWRALHADHGPMIRGDPARAPAAPWCAIVPTGAGTDAGADDVGRIVAALAVAFADRQRGPP
jgi:hypothetical protein